MSNKTTEALKLAEEALVEYRDNQYIKAPRRVLAAIREALAEPELNLNCPSVQARLATVWGYVKAEPDDLDWITPEAVFEAKLKAHGIPNPTAEPVKHEAVAKIVLNRANQIIMQAPDGDYFDMTKYVGKTLYTSPVQREWVDMSEDELASVDWASNKALNDFARAVIAAFKEKNK